MKNKIFLFLILSIFLIGIVSSQVSYCCERLDSGAWCQNADASSCDPDYASAPTSCEATSYCRLGTCINTGEGTCMPNSPQSVCSDPNGDGDTSDGGVWDAREKSDIPQCQLGCCLIGDQAAFVTQTRCKSLSSIYGLEVNYRTDIQNEIECIASASADVKGACVFEEEYQRNCKMLSKKECQEIGTSIETEFYEGYLCSAEELETICGPRGGTTCVEGRDEVYFLDTCGNLANVYDYSKLNDNNNYWAFIQEPECGDTAGNKDSKTCGNCDYFLGSTCKNAERGNNPSYGDYICKNLDCEYNGETYQHGETWCAYDRDSEESSLPGARNFRMVCYNNEVSIEPCADFRQEVCIQSSIGDFSTAACRVNMWQDCFSQNNQQDCENIDKRDCKWLEGASVLIDENGQSLSVDESGIATEASCVPKYAPGFDFWEEGGDAESMCSMASVQCVVDYEAGLFTGGFKNKKVTYNAECYDACREAGGDKDDCEEECTAKCVDEDGELDEEWMDEMKALCIAIGDCGSKTNYLGNDGYNDWESSFVRGEDEEEEEESE